MKEFDKFVNERSDVQEFLDSLDSVDLPIFANTWGQKELADANVLLEKMSMASRRLEIISLLAEYRAMIRTEILTYLKNEI